MKKSNFLFCIFLLFLISCFAFSTTVRKAYFTGSISNEFTKNVLSADFEQKNLFDAEISRGNLIISKVQNDSLAGMKHYRYTQKFKGLPVFGGEVVYHLKNDKVASISGKYFQIRELNTIPKLSREDAVEIFRSHLQQKGLEVESGDSQLVIFAGKDNQYHLAYQITLKKEDYYSMTGIIDARTGEILFQFSNINFDEAAIGLGVGYHGATFKVATTQDSNGSYYLYDEKRIRPYSHYTYDYRTGYIPGDSDNYWDNDGPIVNAHVFVGLIYDFYYLFFERKGIDDRNLTTIVKVYNNKSSDNAFWNGKSLNFCTPGKLNIQMAAAFDVVGHEYTHGITQYSSDLVYAFESGALNEAFSDMMGATAEFYWFPEGSGLYKADWYMMEDAFPYYKTSGAGIRNLADPNSCSQLGDSRYPDPCHLFQEYYVSSDFDHGGGSPEFDNLRPRLLSTGPWRDK